MLEVFSRNDSQKLRTEEKDKDTLNRDTDFVIAEFKEFADRQLHELGQVVKKSDVSCLRSY